MLKMWVFILLIEGKQPEAVTSDSEASCRRAMAILLAAQREMGNTA